MIKLEVFSNDADVTFVRNNFAQKAFVGNLLTQEEFDTLEIKSGTVTYSIDELKLITIDSTKTEIVMPAEETIAETEDKKIIFPDSTKK
jgi:hypothetical protein